MIITELYKGQGLGNQLACYVTTRVIALDRGFDFGIMNPQNFKGLDFLNLDFGEKIEGGNGPQGGPPISLPKGINKYYREKALYHPNGSDIRDYDLHLINIEDNTKIDGLMQGEAYFEHRKDEIRQWLKVKPEFEFLDYSDENTCVINFRGGEYTRHPEFYLQTSYWRNAVTHMLKINKNFRFIVITDDVLSAKKFFPNYDVFHFSIAKDYIIIKNAHYLILSNSSFAWFPAWLNENLKYCIAPKYWARHNISDGYWSLGYNITKGWNYLDREGVLHDYDSCLAEMRMYNNEHSRTYTENKISERSSIDLKSKILEIIPIPIKTFLKGVLNESRYIINLIRKPLDILNESKRRKLWLTKLEISNYRKKIKIYDVFNFFNELELLEMRLNILNDYVDYFVLVESRLTHSGMPKELYYENNKEKFKKFHNKIIHYVIENPLRDFTDLYTRLKDKSIIGTERFILEQISLSDNINDKESFLRDFYEKESVRNPLEDLGDNDFCFVSDLDEIWNPEAIIDYSKDDIFKLKQEPYMYYLNNRTNEDWSGWTGTIGTKYKNIKNGCLNHLRTKSKTKYTVVKNGGWHFSFIGGTDRVKKKIESYSHQEINNSKTKSKITKSVMNNIDIRGKGLRFWKDDTNLPRFILENKSKYKNLFK